MKKYLLLFVLILSAIPAFAQHYSQKDLTGKWQVKVDKDHSGIITFTSDSKITISSGGQDAPQLKYAADFIKDPIKLAITVTPPGGAAVTLRGLLKFITANTIKMELFPNGTNPADFDNHSQTTMSLSRIGK